MFTFLIGIFGVFGDLFIPAEGPVRFAAWLLVHLYAGLGGLANVVLISLISHCITVFQI